MASSTIRELFEQGTKAFNDHDIDAFAQHMADDVTVRAPGGIELTGRSAVSGFYRGWMDAFPDAHVDVPGVHVLQDAVVEEGVFSGTHRGTLKTPQGDLPATGRSVRVEYIQVVRYRGDQVASFHVLFDRVEMLEQLGVMGAAAEAGRARAGAETAPAQPPMH